MTTAETPKTAAPGTEPTGGNSAPARVHLAERLRAAIAEATEGSSRDGHDTIEVPAARFADAARVLRDREGFGRFVDVTCVDAPEHAARFEVHLVVYSMDERRWARLKARTADKLPSVVQIYAGAHNYEREVFDLFGVVFEGHPRLTRIMLPDGWQGHPLRRDDEMPVEPVDFTVTRDLYNT